MRRAGAVPAQLHGAPPPAVSLGAVHRSVGRVGPTHLRTRAKSAVVNRSAIASAICSTTGARGARRSPPDPSGVLANPPAWRQDRVEAPEPGTARASRLRSRPSAERSRRSQSHSARFRHVPASRCRPTGARSVPRAAGPDGRVERSIDRSYTERTGAPATEVCPLLPPFPSTLRRRSAPRRGRLEQSRSRPRRARLRSAEPLANRAEFLEGRPTIEQTITRR